MADPKGFLKYDRALPPRRAVAERLQDHREVEGSFSQEKTVEQASRCMDCGVPFCHSACPLGNVIPEFNDAVYENNWAMAYRILADTNNFPEFTGRICPAPCESACVLGINQNPITIEHIEKSIIEMAFEQGWVRPQAPVLRTGKKVAVIGSGPAGLATAAQLNKAGHLVTVFERKDRIGGLLRYGIPDFKLEKEVLDRRIQLMEAEGIRFQTNANVGENIAVEDLMAQFDALVLCGGSTVPRDLPIPGRRLKGVHFAMEFLEQNNRRIAGDKITTERICAAGKNVVVIGGGDTGSDCLGTSHRQDARSVTQIELLAKPPAGRAAHTPWPLWPMQLRTSSSHEEGGERQWAMLTKAFIGNEQGELSAIQTVQVRWGKEEATGKPRLQEIPGTEEEIACDLAFLAIGYQYPQFSGMLEQLGLELDDRGNVNAKRYQTNVPKVFTAGDMRRGQSLVVWAIAEGREAAHEVDRYLMSA
ncbi:MAG: glutamate synthase subunit beta [Bacteroidota bacterium]